MPKQLLTDKQAQVVEEGPDAVDSDNRWNYRNTIEENLNRGVAQLLRLGPDLLPYLDRDQFQSAVDPSTLGILLGDLLSREQRRTLATMLVWGEQRPDESDPEFRDRIPDLLAEFRTEVENNAEAVRYNDQHLDFLEEIAGYLRDELDRICNQSLEDRGVTMAVPVSRIVDWVRDQKEVPNATQASDLICELYSPWDGGVQKKVSACRHILIGTGEELNVPTTRPSSSETMADKWALHLPPTDADYEQYKAVIDGLEKELEMIVEQYFEEEQIIAKDRLIQEAFDCLENLSKPARDILEWDELSNNRPEWRGHHTRTANNWAENRSVQLMRSRTESENSTDWEWTTFGKVVRWLHSTDIERRTVEQDGFLNDDYWERVNLMLEKTEQCGVGNEYN